jgi:hypothetical protein
MFSMKIEDLVQRIVMSELVGKGREKEALYLCFDVSLSYYTDGDSYDQRAGLHLLYQVNPSYTYVNVFSAVTDSSFVPINKVEKWKHEISHDSCWRNIRVFSDLYFSMANAINEAMVEDGLKKVAPKDMHEYNKFSGFGDYLYRWVPVKISKDKTDENNYRKIIELL